MSFKDYIPFRHHPANTIYHDHEPLQNFRREFERIFGDFSRYWPTYANGGWRGSDSTGYLSPRVNISESPTALELQVELPGVEEKDIDIEINDDQLTLRAVHSESQEKHDEKKHFHLVESSYGTYLRKFTLPFTPVHDTVKAHFVNGVLEIIIPHDANESKTGQKIHVQIK